jgi:hypothetical protein
MIGGAIVPLIISQAQNTPYADECVKKEITASGQTITYYNGCSVPINVVYCKRLGADDIIDIFKDSRSPSCSEKRVEPDEMITSGHIAQENDGFFMQAGSLSQVMTAACKVPYKPELMDGIKHRCVSG